MRRLLIATTNAGKLREIRQLLGGLPLELVTLADVGAVETPEETGRSFLENARLKAQAYGRATGFLTVAEDSGLEIAALDGAPGVESARFGGAGTTYAEKFAFIRAGLERAGVRESPARFVCAVALTEGDQLLFEATGTIEGLVVREPQGTGGFGYDPIFFYPPFGCTLAEAGDRKSAVSHRAKAFGQLGAYLRSRRS